MSAFWSKADVQASGDVVREAVESGSTAASIGTSGSRPSRHSTRTSASTSCENQRTQVVLDTRCILSEIHKMVALQERNLRQLQLPDQLRLPVQSAQHLRLLSVGLYRPHRRRPFQRYAARGAELGGPLQVARRDQGWEWQTPDRYRRARGRIPTDRARNNCLR